MRKMYDSVNANAIPTNAQVVAGYVDGRYAWTQADWNRFPSAVKVRISAIGATHNAHVFDVEPGCIWPPANVVPLVQRARAAGIDPTVYVNEMNDWGPTRAAFDRAGVAHPHWWVANYDGRPDYISAGAVARQYAHPPMLGGAHYDLSAVVDFWPGVDGSGSSGGGGNAVSLFTQEAKAAYDETYADVKELKNALIGTRSEDGRPLIQQHVDFVVTELDRRAAERHEALMTALGELSRSVGAIELGGVDSDAIAGKVSDSVRTALEPVFELARRLES